MSRWFEQARERLGKEYQQVTGTPKLPKRRKAVEHGPVARTASRMKPRKMGRYMA